MEIFKLNSEWIMARANEIPWNGRELTTLHAPSIKTSPWMKAVVPGTILTSLLENDDIPDPFYGTENQNIVDIADSGRDYYTFWFFNNFQVSQSEYTCAWLQFSALNYSADVYLNGSKYELPGGMFFRHKLDVSSSLNRKGENFLAVLVHPPDHPGRIPPEGGQGGDHDIAKDVAAQYVEGWDWIIPIRDRNTGIWDDVTVFLTREIVIADPHLVATFYDNFDRACLHISTNLINKSSESLKCTVNVQVTNELEGLCVVDHVVSDSLEVAGSSTIVHTFLPLFFYKPRLWWPNGLGEHPLYNVEISVAINNAKESDSQSIHFGFRKIDTFVDPFTGGRMFQVNGQPVFIRGGNWIVSDGLLRLSEERYETDISFHAQMNLNMIRVWGGALAERSAFYEACDKHGILVWQEFWITGDCNGRGVPPSDPSWPLKHDVFLRCAIDTVKLLRNHASLALWVGGNEQHPPEDINSALKQQLRLSPNSISHPGVKTIGDDDPSIYLDGTRLYVQGSLWDGFAAGNGEFRDGPYTIRNPEDYFKDDFYAYGFNPEIGSVGVPVSTTIKSTMPEEAWEPPQIKLKDGHLQENPNATWVLHTYIPYSDPGKVAHQINEYGNFKDIDDFCYKAQFVNFVQYRSLIESWNSRMWTKYTGLLIWKTQNPWPGLRGQLYDYFFDQTGGFFGVCSAAEPLHVQINLKSYDIEVVNTTRNTISNASLEIDTWDLEGTELFKVTLRRLEIPAYKTISVLNIPYGILSGGKPVFFLLLKLFDKASNLVSRNFYWLHQPGGTYELLEGHFKTNSVPVKLSVKTDMKGQDCALEVTVQNVSEKIAFWMHFSILSASKQAQGKVDTRILPVNYSQNYISLAPNEITNVNISFRIAEGDSPILVFQGWNVEKVAITLPTGLLSM